MKYSLALAALLGLTLAPAAYAQISCSEVRKIIADAEDDFDGITGAKIEEDFYKATYNLTGAQECTVDNEFDSIYSCGYQYGPYSTAYSAWSSRLAEIGSCLSGWKVTGVPADAKADDDGYRTLTGSLYEGSGDYEDLEWAVVLEEHTDTSGTHYHVWVELAYYWF